MSSCSVWVHPCDCIDLPCTHTSPIGERGLLHRAVRDNVPSASRALSSVADETVGRGRELRIRLPRPRFSGYSIQLTYRRDGDGEHES